jgi:hypothetical protein
MLTSQPQALAARLRQQQRVQQAVYWSTIGLDAAQGSRARGIYVVGYVKTGTNWTCNLLEAALDIPVLKPWEGMGPDLGPYIFHTHRIPQTAHQRARSVAVVRDIRDVVVSAYFHWARRPERSQGAHYAALLNGEMSEENCAEHLPQFIPALASNSRSTAPYGRHAAFASGPPHGAAAVIRYEDLLADTAPALRQVLRQLGYVNVTDERVTAAVTKCDFKAKTGRTQGFAQAGAFLRKGVAGDWHNYFTPESAVVLQRLFGHELISLGYETSDDWVTTV